MTKISTNYQCPHCGEIVSGKHDCPVDRRRENIRQEDIAVRAKMAEQMRQPRTCEHCGHAHGTPMASTDTITCNIDGRRYPAICYCGLYRRRKDEIA
jgi:predicted RNA-binding Zn-ribbon protein involved in translation (DUF1610 family)